MSSVVVVVVRRRLSRVPRSRRSEFLTRRCPAQVCETALLTGLVVFQSGFELQFCLALSVLKRVCNWTCYDHTPRGAGVPLFAFFPLLSIYFFLFCSFYLTLFLFLIRITYFLSIHFLSTRIVPLFPGRR